MAFLLLSHKPHGAVLLGGTMTMAIVLIAVRMWEGRAWSTWWRWIKIVDARGTCQFELVPRRLHTMRCSVQGLCPRVEECHGVCVFVWEHT